MAIKIVDVKTAGDAFRELEQLAFAGAGNIAFRGYRDTAWRLQSTLAQHTRGGETELAIGAMDEMLDRFFACLASVGKLPRGTMSRRMMLEYARHYGVPSPLIDFTRSPYIGLWMAFDGVRPWENGDVAVYVLDVNGLGILWQKLIKSGAAFGEFRWNENNNIFEDGFPLGVLRLLEFAGSWNVRMLRQQGLFVYDSLQYGPKASFQDLEDLIEKGTDPTDPDGAATFTLHKIIVPKSVAREVFERLELMGIDGTRLYDNHEGAVADVKNSYVFVSQTGYTHDKPWRSEG
jgi:hypothetical protein